MIPALPGIGNSLELDNLPLIPRPHGQSPEVCNFGARYLLSPQAIVGVVYGDGKMLPPPLPERLWSRGERRLRCCAWTDGRAGVWVIPPKPRLDLQDNVVYKKINYALDTHRNVG